MGALLRKNNITPDSSPVRVGLETQSEMIKLIQDPKKMDSAVIRFYTTTVDSGPLFRLEYNIYSGGLGILWMESRPRRTDAASSHLAGFESQEHLE